jgi:hypothetical protein
LHLIIVRLDVDAVVDGRRTSAEWCLIEIASEDTARPGRACRK